MRKPSGRKRESSRSSEQNSASLISSKQWPEHVARAGNKNSQRGIYVKAKWERVCPKKQRRVKKRNGLRRRRLYVERERKKLKETLLRHSENCAIYKICLMAWTAPRVRFIFFFFLLSYSLLLPFLRLLILSFTTLGFPPVLHRAIFRPRAILFSSALPLLFKG